MWRVEGKLSLMTKIKLITVIIIAILGFFASLSPHLAHSAEPTKTVTYYVSVNGEFQERLRWVMNNNGEWNRFNTYTSRFRKSSKTFSPVDKNAAKSMPDMIVISDQNVDFGTGRDYYLTSQGITIAERTSKYRFFHDSKNFYSFLKDQMKTSMEFSSNEKDIPNNGLRIIYQISRELPNPSWVVSDQKDLPIYYDFFKGNKEIKDTSKGLKNMNMAFSKNSIFIAQILDKSSKYNVITVAPNYLRFSKPTVIYRNLVDEKNYYQFYKSRALDNLKSEMKNKQNDRKKLKSQF